MNLARIAAWPAYFMGRRLFRAVPALRSRAAGELRGLHWDQQFFSLNTLGKNVEGSAMLRQLLDADENVQRLQMA